MSRNKNIPFRILVLISGIALVVSTASESRSSDDVSFMAPLLGAEHPDAIAGQYIVVMNGDVSARELGEVLSRPSLSSGSNYIMRSYSALIGFAARLDQRALIELRKDPAVSYVEADRRIALPEARGDVARDVGRTGRREASDGLHVYVIDTGIVTSHDDLAGRIGEGYSSVYDKRGFEDCNGHGTRLASTIAGERQGMAKKATVHAVRVLDCNGAGTLSGLVAGVDWVADNHQAPAVAAASLAGTAAKSLDSALATLVARGVAH